MGLFITVEGFDGCGKTSAIRALSEKLKSKNGIEVEMFREPGGTSLGNTIRDILKTDTPNHKARLLLFEASRAMICPIINRLVQDGKIVICDRFTDSTIAYQSFGSSEPMSIVEGLNNYATGILRKPDITFYLEADIKTEKSRVNNRGEHSPSDMESDWFHQRVRDGYHKLMKMDPDRFILIDSNKPLNEVVDNMYSCIIEKIKYEKNVYKKSIV